RIRFLGCVHRDLHSSFASVPPPSLAFGKLCDEAGVRPSVGSIGDCFDNAMCERFFATLECELLDRRRFKTQIEARMAIFEFIEGWYNPHRRHSALDYLSPIDYERAYGAQLNFPSGAQQPFKESAPPPPPAASGKIEDRQRPHLNQEDRRTTQSITKPNTVY